MKKFLLLLMIVFFLFSFNSASGVMKVGGCPQKLDAPGEYVLENNLKTYWTGSYGPKCIEITSPGVTLDCQWSGVCDYSGSNDNSCTLPAAPSGTCYSNGQCQDGTCSYQTCNLGDCCTCGSTGCENDDGLCPRTAPDCLSNCVCGVL